MADMLTRLSSVEVSDDGGSNYVAVGGIDAATLSVNHDTIDTTDNDSGGYKSNEYGESQLTVSVAGNADEADAGLNKLHTASQNKTKVKFRVRSRTASGAKQWVCDSKLSKFDVNQDRNNIVKYSVELESSGAPVYTVQ